MAWAKSLAASPPPKRLKMRGEVLVGKDPFQLNAIQTALENHFGEEGASERGTAPWDKRRIVHVFSAIEVACFDIMGKAIGRPVCDLLGGRARDRGRFLGLSLLQIWKAWAASSALAQTPMPLAGLLCAKRPPSTPRVVAEAKAMCDEYGFKSIKLMPPDEEADAMLALQEAFGPGTPLRLDPNAIWSVDTSIRVGKRLEGVLEYYEDPTCGQENMGKVGRGL